MFELMILFSFIHNVICRHRDLTVLLHDPDRFQLTLDPFRPDEQDPYNSQAILKINLRRHAQLTPEMAKYLTCSRT